MPDDENKAEDIRKEKYINLGITLFILLLAAETWKLLDEKWDSLNYLPVHIYAGVLFFIYWRKKLHIEVQALKGNKLRNGLAIYFYFSGGSF